MGWRGKRRLSFGRLDVLGIVFLVLGFVLFLAEAGYGVLRDWLSAVGTPRFATSSRSRDGARELIPSKAFR
jgi:hypothetical protein